MCKDLKGYGSGILMNIPPVQLLSRPGLKPGTQNRCAEQHALLPCSYTFESWLAYFLISPKRLHGVKRQNTEVFISTDVTTSDPTQLC
jgi:hypothetical protein